MAIATEIRPDVRATLDAREVSAALTILRKLRPRKRGGVSAWHTHALLNADGSITGGNVDAQVTIPGVGSVVGDDPIAVAYDALGEVAKGCRAELTIGADYVRREDSGAWTRIASSVDELADLQRYALPGDVLSESHMMICTVAVRELAGLICTVPARELAGLIGSVVSQASRDESRPVLTAVHFSGDADEATLEVAATDSYRLAMATAPQQNVGAGPYAVNVPRSAAIVAQVIAGSRRASGGDGMARLYLTGEDSGAFGLPYGDGSARARVAFRQVVGQYPNYSALFPQDRSGSVTFAADELRRVVSAWKGDAIARIVAHSEGLTVERLDNARADEATSVAHIAADQEGDGVTVGVNAGFLSDALGSIGGTTATISYVSGLRPIVVSSADYDADLYATRVVVMPIRIAA